MFILILKKKLYKVFLFLYSNKPNFLNENKFDLF